MSWQDILKGVGSFNLVEIFADNIARLLDENITNIELEIGYGTTSFNLNNSDDLIKLAKTGFNYTGYWYFFSPNSVDLRKPELLKYFITAMKDKGYDMEMFDVKGLLTQGSSSESTSQTDYTNKIKDIVQMLTRMNKPVNKETIMYEADMKETEWNDKYDELLEVNKSMSWQDMLKKDPNKGTGKKPKGSARRLYTDEDPSDTVPVKFRTAQDVRETFSSSAFKDKPHKRQSQIINLVEQRARVAARRAKDPKAKKRLNAAHKVALARKESSKRKTQRMKT